jgi:hypothetical protein
LITGMCIQVMGTVTAVTHNIHSISAVPVFPAFEDSLMVEITINGQVTTQKH